MSGKITTDSTQTKLLQDQLSAIPGAAVQGGVRAVNAVASDLRKEVAGWVAEEYAISQGKVLNLLTVNKASAESGRAEAEVVGVSKGGQPMLDFVQGSKAAPSTKRTSGGGYAPAVGVPVQIKREAGAKPLPGGFIPKLGTMHIGVYRRIQGSKKIMEMFLPSPVGILQRPEYADRKDKYVDAAMPGALVREIERELKNAAPR